MSRKTGKALLLRVGINQGTGGALAPIFMDGTFEYIPIPERKAIRNHRSYAMLVARHRAPLADYLPRKLAQARPHVDPDFKTATYADAAPRKCRQLSKLMRHDILAFYCGLAPRPPDDMPRLFAIGYLRVKAVHRVSGFDIKTRRALQRWFGNTAHFVLRVPDRELVLVEGYRTRSRFFRRALPPGDSRDNLLPDLAPFGYQGSIRRAVGHWLRGDAAMACLEAWLRNGAANTFHAPYPAARYPALGRLQEKPTNRPQCCIRKELRSRTGRLDSLARRWSDCQICHSRSHQSCPASRRPSLRLLFFVLARAARWAACIGSALILPLVADLAAQKRGIPVYPEIGGLVCWSL